LGISGTLAAVFGRADHRQDTGPDGFRQLWPGFNHGRQIGGKIVFSVAALVATPPHNFPMIPGPVQFPLPPSRHRQ
jgi:hypothetical protein